MNKKYIVRLQDTERQELNDMVDRLCGSSQKARRARILLQADAEGPDWTDKQISEAYRCKVKTVENTRRRWVEDGFEACVNRKQRDSSPRAKLLDGKQEASLLALRLGTPPPGYANWSLRLLTCKVVELGLVDQISHETVRGMLKKTA